MSAYVSSSTSTTPLTSHYLTAYCDWMQAIGPEELQMSISYGIKQDWKVVLRTERNVQQLAFNLQVHEKAIKYMKDPQDYFLLSEMDTRRIA